MVYLDFLYWNHLTDELLIEIFNLFYRLNRFSFFEEAIPAMKLSNLSSYLKPLNWLAKNSSFYKQAIPTRNH